MPYERINGCKINLAICTPDELQNIERSLGNIIMEREWELSLVKEERQSRRIEVVEWTSTTAPPTPHEYSVLLKAAKETNLDKRNRELLIAKVEMLQDSVADDVIRSICNILLDMIKAQAGGDIGFRTKLEKGEK